MLITGRFSGKDTWVLDGGWPRMGESRSGGAQRLNVEITKVDVPCLLMRWNADLALIF